MVYLDDVKVKVFVENDLKRLESQVNSWVSKEYVLVKDIKHDYKEKMFVWVVLYHEQDKLFEVKKQ